MTKCIGFQPIFFDAILRKGTGATCMAVPMFGFKIPPELSFQSIYSSLHWYYPLISIKDWIELLMSKNEANGDHIGETPLACEQALPWRNESLQQSWG